MGMEIVSADAMQVYRGMDVGTAKPTAHDRAAVPHHMIDVATVGEPFDVARWMRGAEDAIVGAASRGVPCLVVGGTGFYLDALAHGLPTVPPADREVQAPLWDRVEREGVDALRRELARRAPADAERAGVNPRRVVRALEIVLRTGIPPAEFPRRPSAVRLRRFWCVPSMAALRPRIEARCVDMFARGWPDEAASFDAAQLVTARQAIGYADARKVAAGTTSLDDAIAQVTAATIRFAKRQRTWFRGHPAERVVDTLAEDAESTLRRWLTQEALDVT